MANFVTRMFTRESVGPPKVATAGEIEEFLIRAEAEAQVSGSLNPTLEANLLQNVNYRLNRFKEYLNNVGNEYDYGYGPNNLREISNLCWQLYEFDPIIRQGVESLALYTFGQGVNVSVTNRGESSRTSAEDVVYDFWDDPCNFSLLGSTSALISLEIQRQLEGNVFLFFIKMPNGALQVRPIRSTWIEKMIVGDDLMTGGKTLGYIVRPYDQKGTQGQAVAYADILSDPISLRRAMRGYEEVKIEGNGRIAHMKTWGRPWSAWGVPTILAGIDTSQKYAEYLEDWVVVQRALRIFSLMISSKGNSKGIQDMVKKARDAFSGSYNPALSRDEQYSQKEREVGHAVFSGMAGPQGASKLEAFKTAGATEGPEKARELKLQTCAAFGLPETMFGDAKVGNHATAHTLERTVDLRAQANQTQWSDFLEMILGFVVRESGGGRQRGLGRIDITVTFRPIVEHTLIEHVEALTLAYEKELLPKFVGVREVLSALHVHDLEDIMKEVNPERSYGDFYEPPEPAPAQSASGRSSSQRARSSSSGSSNSSTTSSSR